MLLMLLVLLVRRCAQSRLLPVCACTAVLALQAAAWGGMREAVVRVDGCSGVCVDPRGLVLTVRHCDLPDVVSVQFVDRTVAARRVYVCPETEGPVVFDCDGEGYPFLPVASSVPPVGAVVTSYGFPQVDGGRQLRWATGVMLRGSSFEFRGGSFRGNVVSVVCGPGWSGGPLLDCEGHVIGLLSSGDRHSSVFVSFAAVRRAYDAVAATPSGRPTLYVFHSRTCGPCREFDADYTQNAAFSKALDAAFDVVPVDVDERPGTAREFGVNEVPTFIVPGRQPVVGYDGPDELLAALGLESAEPEAAESPIAEPQEPADPPNEPQPPVERPPELPPSEPPPAPAEPAPSPTSDIEQRLDRVLGVAQTAVTVATWLGVSGTTGGVAGLILGGIALSRGRRNRRREQPAARDPSVVVEPPPVVTVDAPPSPPVIVPETKFAPYERDTFAQAFAWAQGEMARKYPGAIGTLESLKGLIDQYLSAKGVRVTDG